MKKELFIGRIFEIISDVHVILEVLVDATSYTFQRREFTYDMFDGLNLNEGEFIGLEIITQPGQVTLSIKKDVDSSEFLKCEKELQTKLEADMKSIDWSVFKKTR